jgi:hypothetical protein
VEVPEKSLRNGPNYGFSVLAKALPETLGALALERMQKDREQRQLVVYWSATERQIGNSGLGGKDV